MAKKATASQTPAKPKGRPKSAKPQGRTPIALSIRGCPEWQSWLDNLTNSLNQDLKLRPGTLERTDAIDMALGRLAASLGVPEAPDRLPTSYEGY